MPSPAILPMSPRCRQQWSAQLRADNLALGRDEAIAAGNGEDRLPALAAAGGGF